MIAVLTPNIYDLLVGFVLMISFMTFTICMVSLKSYVDEEKLRQEKSISEVVAAQIPPERVLSDDGLRRVKIAKIAVIVFALSGAYLAFRRHFM
jgi:hypothetical protein